MSENILTVKDLKTYFYTASGIAKAVDGVSFNIAKGETMGIVGESGSGKSVTSSSIIRLLPPRTGKIVGGSIEFEGKDVLALSKKELNDFRGKDIAVIFQDPMTSLDPVFKIGKQMTEMIMAHQNVTKDEAWKMAVEALSKVGIPEPEKRMNSYPYELSGGMCQRVIIAMAVCCKPKLIIADEPTTALDATGFGYEPAEIPLMGKKTFEADASLRSLIAETCREVNPEIGVFEGRVVSGDQFISDGDVKDRLVRMFAPYCTEMEGAAIAQAAWLNQIPFVIIRAISDKADGSAHMDYSEFEAKAIEHTVRLVEAAAAKLA